MLPKMNWILFSVFCCLFVSGCNESKNPLSDPNADTTDQSLVGVWACKKDVYTVSMPSSDENLPKGVMKCQLQQIGKKAIYFLLIPTKIGDDRFLSVPKMNSTEAKIAWKLDEINRYSLFKYKIAGNTIKLYIRNESATNQRIFDAIKNGDLRGTTDSSLKSGFITEPTEALRKYVQDNEAWLFTEKFELTKK